MPSALLVLGPNTARLRADIQCAPRNLSRDADPRRRRRLPHVPPCERVVLEPEQRLPAGPLPPRGDASRDPPLSGALAGGVGARVVSRIRRCTLSHKTMLFIPPFFLPTAFTPRPACRTAPAPPSRLSLERSDSLRNTAFLCVALLLCFPPTSPTRALVNSSPFTNLDANQVILGPSGDSLPRLDSTRLDRPPPCEPSVLSFPSLIRYPFYPRALATYLSCRFTATPVPPHSVSSSSSAPSLLSDLKASEQARLVGSPTRESSLHSLLPHVP
ncbi:hypothetical protein B0H14DRAFT_3482079 [Mycena olivaceomarginata]|nr:hypothetical protein B0H14DRAFT_3482079 [Mycena olivaceomarginata]